MEHLKKQPVGDIVREKPTAAQVFASYHIDFCCGGKKPLEEVCNQKQINVEEVVNDINNSQDAGTGMTPRFEWWPKAFLADYIEYNHHSYARTLIPVIRQWIEKVAKVHGDWRPETVTIAAKFNQLIAEMNDHFRKEEEIAFPLIKDIEEQKNATDSVNENDIQKLRYLIDEMEEEHEGAGSLMEEIHELSEGFTPPEGACNTFKAAYRALYEFEKDLHQHVHLENNILFPQTLELSDAMKEAG